MGLETVRGASAFCTCVSFTRVSSTPASHILSVQRSQGPTTVLSVAALPFLATDLQVKLLPQRERKTQIRIFKIFFPGSLGLQQALINTPRSSDSMSMCLHTAGGRRWGGVGVGALDQMQGADCNKGCLRESQRSHLLTPFCWGL